MTVMPVERDKISAKLLACVGARCWTKTTHASIDWKCVKQLLESFQPTCGGTDANNWERRLARFFSRPRRSLRRRHCGSRRFSFPTHVQCSMALEHSQFLSLIDPLAASHMIHPAMCPCTTWLHKAVINPDMGPRPLRGVPYCGRFRLLHTSTGS